MKERFFIGCFLLISAINIFATKNEFQKLAGPYLGQKPPGMTPEIFAPGIISSVEFHDFKGAFSPDGKEYYFCRHALPQKQPTLYVTKIDKGIWTEPSELLIAQGTRTFHPCVSSDNTLLMFRWQFGSSQKQLSGYYASARTDTGWAVPQYVGKGFYLTTDQSGRYYTGEIEGGKKPKFYMNEMTLCKGFFQDYVRIKIHPYFGLQTHPCIAPDGSYILFDTQMENSRLFVSFKNEMGLWNEAIDLTLHGLKPGMQAAYISPDGKYMFFGYEGDIWWVDIQLIEQLRP
jgi:Tol biopolymer transport system component